MPKYAYPYCYAPPRQPDITHPPPYTPPPTAWFSLPHKEKTPPKPTRAPPPSHIFSPPSPHKERTPSNHGSIFPPSRVFPPPSPHNMVPPTPQFAPSPPHTVQPPPPRNIEPRHTVITAVCASLGGLIFIAFIAAALCCFIRKKKRMVHRDEMVNDTDHVHAHETVIPWPHGEKIAAMTIDEDVNVPGTTKKNEVDVHNGSNKKSLTFLA